MSFTKYNAEWGNDYKGQDLRIEMKCIQRGGQWKGAKGQTCGLGNIHHYEQMRNILWPDLDDHRWNKLCRDTILTSKITVLLGCASSGKTHSAAWIYLCEYLCFPEETCVLVSSTHMDGLRLRVWAEICMLWQKAIERFPELPGNLIDSRILIATDNINDSDGDDRALARDWRKGIKGIPCVQNGKFIGLSKFQGIKQKRMRLIADEACFPAGTLIDTPNGKTPIEKLSIGDEISNVLGVSRIRRVFKTTSGRLVKIKSCDGREIVCTPLHPIFTNKGWICACELNQSHYMLSAYEAMQVLQPTVQTLRTTANLQSVPRKAGRLQTLSATVFSETSTCGNFVLQSEMQVTLDSSKSKKYEAMREVQESIQGNGESVSVRYVPEFEDNLQVLQGDVCKNPIERRCDFLQSQLLVEMEPFSTGISSEILYKRTRTENISGGDGKAFGTPGICGSLSATFNKQSFDAQSRSEGPHYKKFEGVGAQAHISGWQWNQPHNGGTEVKGTDSRIGTEYSGKNGDEERFGLSNLLQIGHWNSETQIGSGSRRKFSQTSRASISGCKENEFSNGSWVDSVENIEQKDFERWGGSKGRVNVYNLEIEGHPSYSVSGFLVHNSQMGASFLNAFANLDKNEDFRAIILGNPNDPSDPLGKSAEPKDGWSNHLEPTKTEVWETRFMNGKCVNLVGTDSPNFDFPADQPTRYKYLISKEKIENTLSFFPKDSVEYYSNCIGVMKVGILARRVVSRDMCVQFDAFKEAIWDGSTRTRICALDAAYSGDRCALMHIDFGRDHNGEQIFCCYPPVIIPVIVRQDMIAEDQIAVFLKQYADDNDIKPENFYHDSTGRGSLGTSLARIWSNLCNPVEFGGSPTKRPVSLDLFIDDAETGQRRLKRCDEHYSKFVSELAFSVRYVIEGRQMRNLPTDVMEELCLRKWDKVRGDRIEVEPKSGTATKPGMKQRVGFSPDLADVLSICVEGARRRGFEIKKLGIATETESDKDFFETEANDYREAIKAKLLQHR